MKTPSPPAAPLGPPPDLRQADELGLIPECLEGTDLTAPITRAEFAAVAVKDV